MIRNALLKNTKDQSDPSSSEEKNNYLPQDLCDVMNLPLSELDFIMCLPSVLHEMEFQLNVLELQKKIGLKVRKQIVLPLL